MSGTSSMAVDHGGNAWLASRVECVLLETL